MGGETSPMERYFLMRRTIVSLILVLVVAASVSLPVQSQSPAKREIVADVAFEFYVGDTSVPPGKYSFSAPGGGSQGLTIRAVGGKAIVDVPVVTRLARQAGASKTNLVFDKTTDRSYLSEVWIPGVDGYLVRGTTGEHLHVVVDTEAAK